MFRVDKCMRNITFHYLRASVIGGWLSSLPKHALVIRQRLPTCPFIGVDLTGILGGRMAGLTVKVLLQRQKTHLPTF